MDLSNHHLYMSWACPYSARAVLARCIMQLEAVVSMSALNPVRGPDGWVFGDGEYADPLNGFRRLREAYKATDSGYEGRVSVPVLWDRKARRIVSTESGDIMRMFGGETLCPEPLRAEIEALDELEQRLGKSRFLFGDEPVESDWRLFPTLVRFDTVYSPLFKCTRQLAEMPSLHRHTRELYRRPGIAATVRHDEILQHYYRSFPALNPHGIVPLLAPPDFGN